jgi:DNA polymerase I
MKNILLVDTCYTVFFRFNATKRWFSLAHAEEYVEINDDQWLDNTIFKEKYQDMYMKGFEKHMKKLNIDEMIWAQDDSTQNVWRTKLYPEYKAGRDENITCKSDQVFTFTYNEFLPKFFKQHKIKTIKEKTAEADDIIAIASKYFSEQGHNVFIVSSDTDLVQLVNDKVKIFDLKMKEVAPKISPEMDLKLKIIIGDKSDNIPAIKPKVGKKTGEKLLNDNNKLTELLKDESVNQRFIMNKLLIDLNMIPEVLRKKITSKVKKISNEI